MELQQNDIALQVIDTLNDEDDDVFEVWYLQGLANYYLKDFKAAKEDFKNAESIFAKHGLQQDPSQAEIASQIQQLVAEMGGEEMEH
jgi:hypothetical protein